MPDPLDELNEPALTPEAEEHVTPLTDALDELNTTVEAASDSAAGTVDDIQAATGEVAASAEETISPAMEAAADAVEVEALVPVTEVVEEPAKFTAAAEELPAVLEEPVSAAAATTAAAAEEIPAAAVPPLPVVAATPGEVTSDDRLISALNWLGLVLLQLPLVSIVILLVEGNKDRPFQRHHAIQGLGFWVGAAVYEILAMIVFTVGSIVTLGLGALCLWVIFFLPHLLALVYAWQAYQGKELNIPLVTKFMRQQGWLA